MSVADPELPDMKDLDDDERDATLTLSRSPSSNTPTTVAPHQRRRITLTGGNISSFY